MINSLKKIKENDRLLSLAAGAYFLFCGLKGKKSITNTLAAGYLLYRGAKGYGLSYESLKINSPESNKNITVKSYITINKPRNEVYNFWRRLDNLPFFMNHLESVTVMNEIHAEWKAKIPGGFGTIDWKSEIISDVRDEYIAWRSLPESEVMNSGIVKFSDAGKFGTEIQIELSYHAPGGIIGERLGKLLNPVLENMIKNDIKNFRKYFETGEIPTYEGQPSGK